MEVIKFGGTSVGSAESIEKLFSILKNKNHNGRYVIVFSSFSGITDALIQGGKLAAQRNEKYHLFIEQIEIRYFKTIRKLFSMIKASNFLRKTKKILNELEIFCESIFQLYEIYKRSIDKLMSYGELISSLLIFEKLKLYGFNVVWKDSRDLIFTDENFGCANVDFSESSKRIKEYFEQENASYILFPGFIAYSKKQKTTTLGRGGSDYTASIISAAINANILEIWTDVSGLMTTDPNLVNQTFPINRISYKEAMELSYFGAKVIYFPTIFPNLEKGITIHIKNTFYPLYYGTKIDGNKKNINNIRSGISSIKNLAILTIEGHALIEINNYNSKILFETLSSYKTNIRLINKMDSESSLTVGIPEKKIIHTKKSFNEFYKKLLKKEIITISIEKDICMISVIGSTIKKFKVIIGKIFSALEKKKLNIRTIAQGYTEKNIAVLISKTDFRKTMNILHETLFEITIKKMNIFISGLGKVGAKFIDQLQKQKKYIVEKLKLQIRVIGISNSRLMYFNNYGINEISQCKNYLQHGERMNSNIFFKKLKNLNLRNRIFIDNTNNKDITNLYEKFLSQKIGVITCNKMACSSSYEKYKKLKKLSIGFQTPFLFETNVGAGLPIISTLNDLINSGDKIHLIEAVFSGSLNCIFNQFQIGYSFIETVKEAQRQGYTEPDPRLDLSGVDVMRKIIILVRECGEHLELKDIKQKIFLPFACLKASSLDDFYKELKKNENHFIYLKKKAEKKSECLRYIAQYKKNKTNKKVSVGLKNIGINHPFYKMEGTDNMIIYTTKRYSKSPLIIKGSGAGASVTASGIFADLIKASI